MSAKMSISAAVSLAKLAHNDSSHIIFNRSKSYCWYEYTHTQVNVRWVELFYVRWLEREREREKEEKEDKLIQKAHPPSIDFLLLNKY